MKNYKILVVDDDPDIVEILTYNLKIDGYDVINVFNGKEAVKKNKIICSRYNFSGSYDAYNEKIYVESDFGVGSEFSFTLEKTN